MARITTQKLVSQSRAQSRREHTIASDLERRHEYLAKQDFESSNRWSVPGIHFGKPLDQLPIKYLFWILDNFDQGKHRQRAEGEIYRRYHETSDTQGGRAGSNSAV